MKKQQNNNLFSLFVFFFFGRIPESTRLKTHSNCVCSTVKNILTLILFSCDSLLTQMSSIHLEIVKTILGVLRHTYIDSYNNTPLHLSQPVFNICSSPSSPPSPSPSFSTTAFTFALLNRLDAYFQRKFYRITADKAEMKGMWIGALLTIH